MTVFITEQLLFVHVPKTAGTTLRHFMEGHFAPESIFPSQTMIDKDQHIYHDMARIRHVPGKALQQALLVRGHLPYHEIRSLLAVQPVTLTMLRNPVRRAISEIYHHKRHGDPQLAALSLEEVIERHPGAYRSQWSYFGRSPEEALRNISTFDWVGIQEMFEASLEVLCGQMGWVLPKTFARENTMPSSQEEAISLTIFEMLSERLVEDMEFYLKARRIAENAQKSLRQRVA